MDEATDFIVAYNGPDSDAAVRLSDPEIAWVLQSSNSCGGGTKSTHRSRCLTRCLKRSPMKP